MVLYYNVVSEPGAMFYKDGVVDCTSYLGLVSAAWIDLQYQPTQELTSIGNTGQRCLKALVGFVKAFSLLLHSPNNVSIPLWGSYGAPLPWCNHLCWCQSCETTSSNRSWLPASPSASQSRTARKTWSHHTGTSSDPLPCLKDSDPYTGVLLGNQDYTYNISKQACIKQEHTECIVYLCISDLKEFVWPCYESETISVVAASSWLGTCTCTWILTISQLFWSGHPGG